MSNGVASYIKDLSNSLAYPGAHALYFPHDKVERRTANLRLAREFGVGLADSPVADVDREIGSAYGLLVVKHSFDLIGVQIDAKEFVSVARKTEAAIRRKTALYKEIETVTIPTDGYSDDQTDFVAPLQRAADEAAPGIKIRVLWDTFDMYGYHGDSDVVAMERDAKGNIRIYSLPVRQEDEELTVGYAHILWMTLGCIADGACDPLFTVNMADAARFCEDGYNLLLTKR